MEHHKDGDAKENTIGREVYVLVPFYFCFWCLLPVFRKVVAGFVKDWVVGAFEPAYWFFEHFHHVCVVDEIHQGFCVVFLLSTLRRLGSMKGILEGKGWGWTWEDVWCFLLGPYSISLSKHFYLNFVMENIKRQLKRIFKKYQLKRISTNQISWRVEIHQLEKILNQIKYFFENRMSIFHPELSQKTRLKKVTKKG